ncbi:hypothetical protein Leryth_014637 [Lithospermum erythrorhizon]|nr:hypothetical protein Leryth_014637 [Lithospermum erythrorhizon]
MRFEFPIFTHQKEEKKEFTISIFTSTNNLSLNVFKENVYDLYFSFLLDIFWVCSNNAYNLIISLDLAKYSIFFSGYSSLSSA